MALKHKKHFFKIRNNVLSIPTILLHYNGNWSKIIQNKIKERSKNCKNSNSWCFACKISLAATKQLIVLGRISPVFLSIEMLIKATISKHPTPPLIIQVKCGNSFFVNELLTEVNGLCLFFFNIFYNPICVQFSCPLHSVVTWCVHANYKWLQGIAFLGSFFSYNIPSICLKSTMSMRLLYQ